MYNNDSIEKTRNITTQNEACACFYSELFSNVTLELSSILKSKNIEFFLHFSDISDIREKILHIPNIEVFYGKNDVSRNIAI